MKWQKIKDVITIVFLCLWLLAMVYIVYLKAKLLFHQ